MGGLFEHGYELSASINCAMICRPASEKGILLRGLCGFTHFVSYLNRPHINRCGRGKTSRCLE